MSDYFGGKSDLKECRDNEREDYLDYFIEERIFILVKNIYRIFCFTHIYEDWNFLEKTT